MQGLQGHLHLRAQLREDLLFAQRRQRSTCKDCKRREAELAAAGSQL